MSFCNSSWLLPAVIDMEGVSDDSSYHSVPRRKGIVITSNKTGVCPEKAAREAETL